MIQALGLKWKTIQNFDSSKEMQGAEMELDSKGWPSTYA